MNAPFALPAQAAGTHDNANRDAFRASALQDTLTDWVRDNNALSIRYTRQAEFNRTYAEWKAGKLYARLFQCDDPSNVEEAAEALRTYFNFDPDNDCVFDEGALPGPDGFDLAGERVL